MSIASHAALARRGAVDGPRRRERCPMRCHRGSRRRPRGKVRGLRHLRGVHGGAGLRAVSAVALRGGGRQSPGAALRGGKRDGALRPEPRVRPLVGRLLCAALRQRMGNRAHRRRPWRPRLLPPRLQPPRQVPGRRGMPMRPGVARKRLLGRVRGSTLAAPLPVRPPRPADRSPRATAGPRQARRADSDRVALCRPPGGHFGRRAGAADNPSPVRARPSPATRPAPPSTRS